MNPIRRRTALWAVLVLLAGSGPVIARKARRLPTLGQFAAPATFSVMAGQTPYAVSAPSLTFTPVTVNGQLRYAVTGQVTLTPGPGPVPVPTPTPTPAPTPTPVPTPTPQPVPPGAISVKSFGAKGDGVSDDTAAMQRAVSSAKAGDTVYWPSGTYVQKDQIKMNHVPAITLMGDGPTSILKSVAGMNLYVGTGGESGGPVTVKNLFFQGTPGATMQSSILPTGGIQVFGPNDTVIQNCDFHDCMSAVFCAGTSSISKRTQVTSCRVQGWARVAFFLNGGETISNCQVIQTDPDRYGEKTSHGFYIHSGCDNVTIQDCNIVGARKYAAQWYGEQLGTTLTNSRMLRCTISDCANGLIVASSQPGAADVHGLVIDHCTISGIYAGSSIAIKQGDGITISNNTINGNTGSSAGHSGMGLYVGWWAPYDNVGGGPWVRNADIFGNTITGADRGFSSLASNGGHFSNISVHDNYFWGNNRNTDIDTSTAGAGVTLTNNHLNSPPGAPRSVAKARGTENDTKPGS